MAHLVIGDGVLHTPGIRLCTDSYSIVDVVRLINVLTVRYRLNCSLNYHRGIYPRIYISAHSIPLLRATILPFIHPSIYYKLGL